jgi:hypothetical protein
MQTISCQPFSLFIFGPLPGSGYPQGGLHPIPSLLCSTPRNDQKYESEQDDHSEHETQVVLISIVMDFIDRYIRLEKRHDQGHWRDKPMP